MAERPALLIMARSKARAAAISVEWSPSEVVLPWEEIWRRMKEVRRRFRRRK